MTRRYYYTEKDVRKQRNVNERVLGSRTTARPYANRKGPRLAGSKLHYLVNCDDPSDTKVTSNLKKEHENKVVALEGKCWLVQDVPKELNCTVGECVEVLAIYDDCNECSGGGAGGCWKFTPCTTGSEFIVSSNTFGKYNNLVVKWKDDLCYTVTTASSCSGAIPGTDDDVKSVYLSCDLCDTVCQLESCFDQRTVYINSDTFFPEQDVAEGKIVRLDGECFDVIDIDAIYGGAVAVMQWDGVFYDDCPTCGCHEFHLCSPGSGTKYVSKATWFGGGGPFDLGSLAAGEVVGIGSPNAQECWEYIGITNDPGNCATSEEIEVIQEYKDCLCCTGWLLTECSPGTDTVYTNSGDDLCEYYDDATGMKADTVIKRADVDGKCFDQLARVPLTDAVAWEEFLIDKVTKTCEQCETPLFKLVDADCAKQQCKDCDDGVLETPVVTDDDLTEYVDLIIKYKGTCWRVEEAPGETITDPAPLDFDGPYNDCDVCNDASTCMEVVTNINWTTLEVTYTTYAVAHSKCEERTGGIPTVPCP